MILFIGNLAFIRENYLPDMVGIKLPKAKYNNIKRKIHAWPRNNIKRKGKMTRLYNILQLKVLKISYKVCTMYSIVYAQITIKPEWKPACSQNFLILNSK